MRSLASRFMGSAVVAALLFVTSSSFAAEYLVKYKNKSAYNSMMNMSLNMGMAMVDKHDRGQYIVVDIKKATLMNSLAALSSNSNVEWVVPNFKLKAFGVEGSADAAALKEQWANIKVNAEKAWARAGNKGSKNIILAVIDTGVDYKHPSLVNNAVPGYDFRDNDADPMDETSDKNPGHGTHCAGSAAGTGLSDGGVIGLSPEVSLMPIRFLGADGSGDLNQGIKAIDYAISKNVSVISASWGAAVQRSMAAPLIEAVQRADDKGVIFVAAAANDGKSNDTRDVFPANSGTKNMISVAASTSADAKPQWSNFGKASVHVAAPGEKIMSSLPGGKYGELSGTSMATPLVAGLVSFLKAQDPSLTGAQIRALLQTTGAKVEIETACNCRVDAFNAVDHLLAKKMWLVPAASSVPEGTAVKVEAKNAIGAVKFASSNTAVATVDANGTVTPVSKGTTRITATDSQGTTMTSLDYDFGVAPTPKPGGDCPLGEQALCDLLCQIMPQLPICMAKN